MVISPVCSIQIMVNATTTKGMMISGLILVLLNVAALSPLSTGAVEEAVEDNFETYPKDSACEDKGCTKGGRRLSLLLLSAVSMAGR